MHHSVAPFYIILYLLPVWLCEKLSSCFEACCGWVSKKCDVVVESISRCVSSMSKCIGEYIKWICEALWTCLYPVRVLCNYLIQALSQCSELIRGTVGQCFDCLGRCASAVCTLVWDYIVLPANKYIIEPTGRCLSACCTAIREYIIEPTIRCVSAFLGLIYTYVMQPTMNCVAYVAKAMYENVLTPIYVYVLSPLGSVLRAIASALYRDILKPIGNAIRSVVRATSGVLSAIGRAFS